MGGACRCGWEATKGEGDDEDEDGEGVETYKWLPSGCDRATPIGDGLCTTHIGDV